MKFNTHKYAATLVFLIPIGIIYLIAQQVGTWESVFPLICEYKDHLYTLGDWSLQQSYIKNFDGLTDHAYILNNCKDFISGDLPTSGTFQYHETFGTCFFDKSLCYRTVELNFPNGARMIKLNWFLSYFHFPYLTPMIYSLISGFKWILGTPVNMLILQDYLVVPSEALSLNEGLMSFVYGSLNLAFVLSVLASIVFFLVCEFLFVYSRWTQTKKAHVSERGLTLTRIQRIRQYALSETKEYLSWRRIPCVYQSVVKCAKRALLLAVGNCEMYTGAQKHKIILQRFKNLEDDASDLKTKIYTGELNKYNFLKCITDDMDNNNTFFGQYGETNFDEDELRYAVTVSDNRVKRLRVFDDYELDNLYSIFVNQANWLSSLAHHQNVVSCVSKTKTSCSPVAKTLVRTHIHYYKAVIDRAISLEHKNPSRLFKYLYIDNQYLTKDSNRLLTFVLKKIEKIPITCPTAIEHTSYNFTIQCLKLAKAGLDKRMLPFLQVLRITKRPASTYPQFTETFKLYTRVCSLLGICKRYTRICSMIGKKKKKQSTPELTLKITKLLPVMLELFYNPETLHGTPAIIECTRIVDCMDKALSLLGETKIVQREMVHVLWGCMLRRHKWTELLHYLQDTNANSPVDYIAKNCEQIRISLEKEKNFKNLFSLGQRSILETQVLEDFFKSFYVEREQLVSEYLKEIDVYVQMPSSVLVPIVDNTQANLLLNKIQQLYSVKKYVDMVKGYDQKTMLRKQYLRNKIKHDRARLLKMAVVLDKDAIFNLHSNIDVDFYVYYYAKIYSNVTANEPIKDWKYEYRRVQMLLTLICDMRSFELQPQAAKAYIKITEQIAKKFPRSIKPKKNKTILAQIYDLLKIECPTVVEDIHKTAYAKYCKTPEAFQHSLKLTQSALLRDELLRSIDQYMIPAVDQVVLDSDPCTNMIRHINKQFERSALCRFAKHDVVASLTYKLNLYNANWPKVAENFPEHGPLRARYINAATDYAITFREIRKLRNFKTQVRKNSAQFYNLRLPLLNMYYNNLDEYRNRLFPMYEQDPDDPMIQAQAYDYIFFSTPEIWTPDCKIVARAYKQKADQLKAQKNRKRIKLKK